MLRLGKGVRRSDVKRAFARGRPRTFTYTGVLTTREIRSVLAGIRDAGSPRWARPLLAWLASHPNTPADALRRLFKGGDRGILLGLTLNPRLPPEVRRALLAHPDSELREHAQHVLTRARKH